jgi:hypothetical protein
VSASVIGPVVFGCVFGGALLGMLLPRMLPARHLTPQSKDFVRLAMGLIATMSALVLGLLIAAAKTSYDTQSSQFRQMSAKIVLLDRVMAHYGPETAPARDLLRQSAGAMLERIDGGPRSGPSEFRPTPISEHLYEVLARLQPQGESQRSLRTEARTIAMDIALTRWLLVTEHAGSIPMPFLVMLVFWLAIIFASFGLLAPRDGTALATLFICSVSLAGAIFLILELDRPFDGLIRFSSAPLQDALTQLGR